ncbi:hypothetical protein [uncultured Ferrimonas sp.]|uniref:hypothetical protein n=1 Tax=uncultured Ferrimonas sp. TaxID=432640 RepID=UPI002634DC45|nr:hypothetical protein [uncultured Ferrimonas sp.]
MTDKTLNPTNASTHDRAELFDSWLVSAKEGGSKILTVLANSPNRSSVSQAFSEWLDDSHLEDELELNDEHQIEYTSVYLEDEISAYRKLDILALVEINVDSRSDVDDLHGDLDQAIEEISDECRCFLEDLLFDLNTEFNAFVNNQSNPKADKEVSQ